MAQPILGFSNEILAGATATGAGLVYQTQGKPSTFQAYGSTSSGAGSAIIQIQVSNDSSLNANTWLVLGTITLTLGTTITTDGFASIAPWQFIRANVTTLSGTGASVDVWMGV